MKTFQYEFQGHITVRLDDNNNLLELLQEGVGFVVKLTTAALSLTMNGNVYTYPNTMESYRKIYELCGFKVEYHNESASERVIISDGVSTKEMIYDNMNGNYIVALVQPSKRVLLSTGSAGWSCTSTINAWADIKRGSKDELNICPQVYAAQLEQIFI